MSQDVEYVSPRPITRLRDVGVLHLVPVEIRLAAGPAAVVLLLALAGLVLRML